MQNSYSCGECKNRNYEKTCKRCVHRVGKRPTKFKLDESVQPCHSSSSNLTECSLITDIRRWKEEIQQIDNQIHGFDKIDIYPIMEFMKETARLSQLCECIHHSELEQEIIEERLSQILQCIDIDKLIGALMTVHTRESVRSHLRNQRTEIQQKITEARIC